MTNDALDRLADGLRTGDPDRLALTLLAPASARPRLLTLYALNLELARTALSAREPLVAQMRVQWWIERLEAMTDGAPPPHELLTPLWAAWGTEGAGLSALAHPRMRDAAREPLARAADVADYAAATGGALMGWAVRATGHTPGAEVGWQGQGAGIVAWLRAEPALRALNLGLERPDDDAFAAIAELGIAAFGNAAAGRRNLPAAAWPVLFGGVQSRRVLSNARQGLPPSEPSPFARRAAFAAFALTRRWWVSV